MPANINLREVKTSPLRTNLIFTKFISTICLITDSKYNNLKTSRYPTREWHPRKELVQAIIINKRVTHIKTSRILLWKTGKICLSSRISWKATLRSRQILLENRWIQIVLQPIICLWSSRVYRTSKCLRPRQISSTKEVQWSPALENQPMVLNLSLEVAKRALLLEVLWFLKARVEIKFMSEDRPIIKMLAWIPTLAPIRRWTPETYLLILETMFCTAVLELLFLNRWLDLMVKEQFTKLTLLTNMVAETVRCRTLMPSLVLQSWATQPLDTIEITPQTSLQTWSSEAWLESISWTIRYCSPNLIKKRHRLRICTCSSWHSITDRTR